MHFFFFLSWQVLGTFSLFAMYLILLESIKNDRRYGHIKNLSSAFFFFSWKNRENYIAELWHILATALDSSTPKQEKHGVSPNGRKTFWANLEYCITLVIFQIQSKSDNTHIFVVQQTPSVKWSNWNGDLEMLNSWACHVQVHVTLTLGLYFFLYNF